MKIRLTEDKLKKIISSVIAEAFRLHNYRTFDTLIQVNTAFPYLTDNENIPEELGIEITCDYTEGDRGDYWTPPSGPDFDYVDCKPLDKQEWAEFVQATGVPEEKLLADLKEYVKGDIYEIASEEYGRGNDAFDDTRYYDEDY